MGPPLTRGAGGVSSGVGAAGGARDPLKSPRRGAAGTIRGEVPPAAPSIPAGLQPRAQIAPKSPIRAGGSQTKGTGEPESLGADGRRWPLSAPREFRLGKASCGSGERFKGAPAPAEPCAAAEPSLPAPPPRGGHGPKGENRPETLPPGYTGPGEDSPVRCPLTTGGEELFPLATTPTVFFFFLYFLSLFIYWQQRFGTYTEVTFRRNPNCNIPTPTVVIRQW